MQIEYEQMLERYKDPINQGSIENPTLTYQDSNPLCGDEVSIQLSIENKSIKEVKFQAQGCSISIASTDLLLDHIKEKNIDEVLNTTNQNVLDLIGFEPSPMRLKCALLGLVAIKKGIMEWKNGTRN